MQNSGSAWRVPDGGTIGGALAVGHSGLRRLGWGPVRDTVLQVRYVSAAGEVVKVGGPTVKNVSGFDLCRLLVGSRGTLGFLADVILRTRPRPVGERWFTSERDPWDLLTELYRPTSILWDGATTWVLLDGHPDDVQRQVGASGLRPADGPPELPEHRWSVTPSSLTGLRSAQTVMGGPGSFVAEIGVGIVHHTRPQIRPTPDRETIDLHRRITSRVRSRRPSQSRRRRPHRSMMLPGAAPRAYVDGPIRDPEAALRAARRAAATWGLGEPVLMRMGMNAIFEADAMVLRVSTPSVGAAASLALADVLARQGLRVPVASRDDVVVHDGMSVTCWHRIESADEPIDWRAVGAMVRVVHGLEPGVLPASVPLPLPSALPWWDFDALLERTAAALDPAARRGIEDTIDRHRDWQSFGGQVVCHGDVHPGNVIMTADGPVLIDWDLLCWAPPGWDHGPMLTWADRWSGPSSGLATHRAARSTRRSPRGTVGRWPTIRRPGHSRSSGWSPPR